MPHGDGGRTIVSETRPDAAAEAFNAALAAPLALDGEWSAWRAFCLRGAGFPLSLLAALETPALEPAVASVLAADEAREAALAAARAACRRVLDDEAPAETRTAARQALRALQRGRAPRVLQDLPGGVPLHEAIGRAHADCDDAAQALAAAFDAEDAALHEHVRSLAAAPRFREAVAWQNRPFLAHGLDRYLASTKTDSGARKRRTVIVRYLQRYTSKNESIGFFGPIGWGRFAPGPPRLVPGPALVSKRRVYFEYRAVEALTRRLMGDEAFMLTIAPRLSPAARLEDDTLHLPEGTLPLAPLQREFLAACDGSASAGDLVERFRARPGTGLATTGDFLVLLRQLVEAGALAWSPPVPVVLHPERHLRAAVEQAADPAARARLLAPLDALERARDAIAEARGVDARIAALEDLDDTFEATTGEAASQHAGRSYAGRTPCFEDCVRDVELELPDTLLEAIAPPLALVLQGARWFGCQLTAQFGEYVGGLVETLRRDRERVPLAELWARLAAETEIATAVVDDVRDQIHERWAAVLPLDTSARRVTLRAADLEAQVREAFPADGPGWPGARFHSPDLMIAARDTAAIEAGEWQAVLGEIHPLLNILTQEVLLSTAPDPDALLARAARERPEPEIVPVKSRHGAGHRMAYGALQANDYHVVYDDSCSGKPAERVLRMADLECARSADGLVLHSRADGRRFDAMDFLGPQIRALAVGSFELIGPREHLPRISIDRLVVQRETWRRPCDTLPFVQPRERSARYLEARRWAAALGLPRYCFYRITGERKPWLVDFHSSLLVDLLTDQVRAARGREATLTISEMLPDPDACWLVDADGERYTCELRMAMRDALPEEAAGGEAPAT